MTTGTADGAASPTRPRWRWMALWSACCVVVLAATFALGSLVRSPWQEAIENSTAVPVVTARVEQRSLAANGSAVVGTVALGSTTDVVASSEAAVTVVTAIRTSPGEILSPGEALADVSGRPLIALALPFRLYRDLVPGADGTSAPDVAAVQQALADLGLYSGAVDGRYGQATVEAVTRLYTRAQLTPPAPSAEAVSTAQEANDTATAAQVTLDAAEQELTAASATLDQARRDRAAATDPELAPDADAAVAEAQSQTTTATTARDTARTARDEARQAAAEAQLAASTPLPMAEVIRVPASGVTVVDVAAVDTELSEDTSSVARLRSGEPVATVRVGASEAAAFTPGVTATVTATTDTSLTVTGTVSAVGPFVAAATESGSPPGYDITVLLPPEQPFTDGQDIAVTVASDAPALEGLAVPLIAVREDSGAPYVLVASQDAGQEPTRTPVTVVGSADGYAVVTGDGIAEGITVVVSDGT